MATQTVEPKVTPSRQSERDWDALQLHLRRHKLDDEMYHIFNKASLNAFEPSTTWQWNEKAREHEAITAKTLSPSSLLPGKPNHFTYTLNEAKRYILQLEDAAEALLVKNELPSKLVPNLVLLTSSRNTFLGSRHKLPVADQLEYLRRGTTLLQVLQIEIRGIPIAEVDDVRELPMTLIDAMYPLPAGPLANQFMKKAYGNGKIGNFFANAGSFKDDYF